MAHHIKITMLGLFLISITQTHSPNQVPMHQMLFIGQKGTTVTMLQKRFKANKPAIFVDFHGVIALKNIRAGIKQLTENGLKTATAKMKFAGKVLKTAVNPIVIGEMINLGVEGNKVTESYLNVVKNNSSEKLHKQLITFTTDIYEPNEIMIDLLYRLKAAGCRIYLFSNGGYETILAVKNDPRFAPLFEGEDPLFEQNCINTSYQDVYTIAKPNPAAFEMALQVTGESAEKALFIDDTREKLCDWRNKVIQEKYPYYSNFWACSFLYHVDNHATLELALKKLAVL